MKRAPASEYMTRPHEAKQRNPSGGLRLKGKKKILSGYRGPAAGTSTSAQAAAKRRDQSLVRVNPLGALYGANVTHGCNRRVTKNPHASTSKRIVVWKTPGCWENSLS